jgi:predicted amidohydrolase YtcJ
MKSTIDLRKVCSISELIPVCKINLTAHNKESWLIGNGWNQDHFIDEKRFPTNEDLDKISTEIPILVTRACFHLGVFNSKAIEILHLSTSSHVLFKEQLFTSIVSSIQFVSLDEFINLIIEHQNDLFKFGITSIHSDDLDNFPNQGFEFLDKMKSLSEYISIKAQNF